MLLAVDAGNTNTVFAVFESGGQAEEAPRGQWRAMTDARRTSDEYAVWLGQLLAQARLGLADIDDAIVSSVVPQGIGALKSLCADHCGCDGAGRRRAGGNELGIEVNVPRPEEVGADRLVNAVGAHVRHEGALIIRRLRHRDHLRFRQRRGRLRRRHHRAGHQASRWRRCTRLRRNCRSSPSSGRRRLIAQATVPAMQSGIYWGYVGLIEGIVARMKAEIEMHR